MKRIGLFLGGETQSAIHSIPFIQKCPYHGIEAFSFMFVIFRLRNKVPFNLDTTRWTAEFFCRAAAAKYNFGKAAWCAIR